MRKPAPGRTLFSDESQEGEKSNPEGHHGDGADDQSEEDEAIHGCRLPRE
jgi:hypothetical protein